MEQSFQKLSVAQLISKCPMSPDPAFGPYSKPDESSQLRHNLLLKHFKINFSPTIWFP
jgi:hypothetical protein